MTTKGGIVAITLREKMTASVKKKRSDSESTLLPFQISPFICKDWHYNQKRTQNGVMYTSLVFHDANNEIPEWILLHLGF